MSRAKKEKKPKSFLQRLQGNVSFTMYFCIHNLHIDYTLRDLNRSLRTNRLLIEYDSLVENLRASLREDYIKQRDEIFASRADFEDSCKEEDEKEKEI